MRSSRCRISRRRFPGWRISVVLLGAADRRALGCGVGPAGRIAVALDVGGPVALAVAVPVAVPVTVAVGAARGGVAVPSGGRAPAVAPPAPPGQGERPGLRE